jgi:predicted sulfurtransferase
LYGKTIGTLILFYKYVDIHYPKQILKWQTKICKELGLKGRVILAHEGINATLAGSTENISLYKNLMDSHPLFTGIDFKESQGNADYFPRLRIVVKDEIVKLGIPADTLKATDGGIHITPAQAHELFKNKPDNVVILDARNNYESKIGKFKDAITPDIKNFRDFPAYIDQNLEQFKDKQVFMYCTGGIRCERASAYLKIKNVAQEVYQLSGGIQRYIEQFPDGFFRGKNYVFDGRIAVKVNEDVLSTCALCATPCDEYNNCMNASCNKHFVACESCYQHYSQTCSTACQNLLETRQVQARPKLKKVDSSCSL